MHGDGVASLKIELGVAQSFPKAGSMSLTPVDRTRMPEPVRCPY